jgi:hypothetical protein
MSDLVEIVRQEVIAYEVERIDVVTIGVGGPPGARGLPGPPGGAGFEAPAGQAIGGHRVVVFDELGKLVYASNADLDHLHRVAGITTAAAETGQPAYAVRSGEVIEPSWSWNMNAPIYLASNGQLTQNPPTAPAAAFSVVVGFPTSATSLFVTIREPIILNQE